MSRRTAEHRVRLACALARLPLTRAALAEGRLDLSRARVVADEVASLDPPTAREVEARVIDVAERLTAGRLRVRVRRAVLAANPLAAQVRFDREKRERRVVLEPAADGMAWLSAYLTATEARIAHTALTSAAKAAKHDEPDRAMDELRADALVAVLTDAMRTGSMPGVGPLARHLGEVTTVQVSIAATSLIGLDDEPAILEGYGPITADEVRSLAPDARWRRILTDPRSGTVLDVGTTVYRPPVPLARHVETVHQRCVAPGCAMPAARCELDHVVPFPEGPTSAANLRPECRHHHQHVKHTASVSVDALADGGTRWTMPTGHTYETRPPPIGLVSDDNRGDPSPVDEPWWSEWRKDARAAAP